MKKIDRTYLLPIFSKPVATDPVADQAEAIAECGFVLTKELLKASLVPEGGSHKGDK